MRTARALLLALIAALLLPACGAMNALGWLKTAFTGKSELVQLRVIADQDANRDTATAVDLVFVYDKDLVALLPKSGPEWFAKRQTVVASQPADIKVVSLQVPPAMAVDAPVPKLGNQPAAVFLFANYIEKDGQFPVNLTAFKSAVVRLKASSIEYTAGEGAGAVSNP